MREFDTGATRNNSDDKYCYEGFFSPAVMECYAEYMHSHRKQADGKLRDADNWQHGISQDVYMDSLLRHVMDLWFMHRGYTRFDHDSGEQLTFKGVCCAILFNVKGYLFEEIVKITGKRPMEDK